MYRVDHATGITADPGTTIANFTGPRFSQGGTPAAGTEATIVEAEWLNMVQEELINAVIASGQTPDKGRRDQLAVAMGFGNFVLKSGDVMTGPLSVPSLGVTGSAAVDNNLVVGLNTRTGNMFVGMAPPADIAVASGQNLTNLTTADAYSFNLYADAGGTARYIQAGRAAQMAASAIDGRWLWQAAPAGAAGQPAIMNQLMILEPDGSLDILGRLRVSSGSDSITARAGNDFIVVAGSTTFTAAGSLVIGGGGRPGGLGGQWAGEFLWLGNLMWAVDAVGNSVSVGDCAAATFNGVSDERLKTKIAPWTAGLAEVLQLNPISFEWGETARFGTPGRTYYGVSAQEVETVLPEAIHRVRLEVDDDDTLTVESAVIFYACLNAIKELAARVVVLESARA
jgi:hypothetical protein